MSARFISGAVVAAAVALCTLGAPAWAQDIPYRIGRWNPDSFGNQRVVLHVAQTLAQAGRPVRALIPWRRRDFHPELKRIIVTDAQGRRVPNMVALRVRRDSGDVVFESGAGDADYYLYYLPYAGSVKSNYPKISYPVPDSTADATWIRSARSGAAGFPRAQVVAFESVDTMSQVWPMEVIATAAEVGALQAMFHGQPMAVFPEDRTRPIKMTADLPMRWVAMADKRELQGTALRDEYFAFQFGIWALESLDSVRVQFGALTGPAGASISKAAFNCINTDGVDWMGRAYKRMVTVASGRVAPIWCGVMVPARARAGQYRGTAIVVAAGGKRSAVPIRLTVAPERVVNHGDDEPWRLSRLRWLDSRLAAEGAPMAPYIPIAGGPAAFSILGRQIALDAIGFPKQITSFFDPGMTRLVARGRPMLVRPIALVVDDSAGHAMTFQPGAVSVTKRSASRVAFRSSARSGALHLGLSGELDFDGNLEYRVALVADRAMPVKDIRLTLPFRNDVARFFMGMSQMGGKAPGKYDWRWDVTRNQDAVWIGDVNAGVQLTIKDEHYIRPLNTNFYQLRPLVMPRSWSNNGRGGCHFEANVTSYDATCYGGPRTLAKGDTLWFNFRLLVTPFHPLDTRTHFDTRYYHAYKPVDTIRAAGANLVNVHHATDINPYINYPFLRPAAMKAYADSVHAANMRFKIYYTVRELTNRAPELWALRSLGSDVLASGPGGGHSWLQEHMVDDYITGWVVPERRDVAMVTSGISRWHNFYVEGMQWLTQHEGVDGIYLDDVAFDRATMLRLRRVLTANGTPGEKIDLHSANQYNKADGYTSSANLYLEHFPFVDRLWFGEYFNYNNSPDYWLVEMSGVPFGLLGEMLQDGGNPWRGMLFGMTARLPWAGDPRAIWKVWDDFGIATAKMQGWWTADAPVTTGRTDILATTYSRPGAALIAVASWASDTTPVRLKINWRALGLDSTGVRIDAPEITGFQPARSFKVGEQVPVPNGRGWLLVVRPLTGVKAPGRLPR